MITNTDSLQLRYSQYKFKKKTPSQVEQPLIYSSNTSQPPDISGLIHLPLMYFIALRFQ